MMTMDHKWQINIIQMTFLCTVVLLQMLVEGRAINKTAQTLENKIKRDKLLAKWQLQHETDLKLDVDKLKPADHLDAVKMEQDGQLNAEYQREIFLGNHEHIGSEAEVVLRDIFLKADVNKDGYLSLEEIEEWISLKIEDHLDEAEGENSRIFALLDSDHDGFIGWTEYLKQFLVVHGHDSEKAEQHINGLQKIDLDETDQAELSRYKSRWTEADHSPPDDQLSEIEFLAFRHPEHSDAMLDAMANDIMNVLDLDKGGNLSLREFISLPAAEVVEEKDQQMDKEWQIDRVNEFNDVIDVDKDGVVSLLELKNYVNPRHPSHAKTEAVNLLKMADDNQDGRLSMEEVMLHRNVLIGSKMVDTGRSFHDEF